MEQEIKLTKLASCAGCGAKVGAGMLARLLDGLAVRADENLLVGFDKSDDAAVYRVSDKLALVQTVDFFRRSQMIRFCSDRSQRQMPCPTCMRWAVNPASHSTCFASRNPCRTVRCMTCCAAVIARYTKRARSSQAATVFSMTNQNTACA